MKLAPQESENNQEKIIKTTEDFLIKLGGYEILIGNGLLLKDEHLAEKDRVKFSIIGYQFQFYSEYFLACIKLPAVNI